MWCCAVVFIMNNLCRQGWEFRGRCALVLHENQIQHNFKEQWGYQSIEESGPTRRFVNDTLVEENDTT
jgi:hypothetical protein